MKYCSKCGKELIDEAVVCTYCGCAVSGAPIGIKNEEDEVSIGLCVLSYFIPLFGIIYWAIKHNDIPKKSKACGITALVSWGLGILIYFVIIFAGLLVI